MESKIIFGQMIDYFRKENGLTMVQLGKYLGKDKSSISRWISGERSPKIEEIEEIAAKFDTDVETLIFGFDKDDKLNELTTTFNKLNEKRKDKVVNYASNQYYEQNRDLFAIASEDDVEYIVSGRCSAAGTAIEVDDSLARQDVMPASMVPKGADELVEITGDSMEPLITKGSSVYIRHQPTIENGEIAIVSILDAGVTCKHVCFNKSGKIVLKSENSKYADMVFDADQVRVIGKVLLK